MTFENIRLAWRVLWWRPPPAVAAPDPKNTPVLQLAAQRMAYIAAINDDHARFWGWVRNYPDLIELEACWLCANLGRNQGLAAKIRLVINNGGAKDGVVLVDSFIAEHRKEG